MNFKSQSRYIYLILLSTCLSALISISVSAQDKICFTREQATAIDVKIKTCEKKAGELDAVRELQRKEIITLKEIIDIARLKESTLGESVKKLSDAVDLQTAVIKENKKSWNWISFVVGISVGVVVSVGSILIFNYTR